MSDSSVCLQDVNDFKKNRRKVNARRWSMDMNMGYNIIHEFLLPLSSDSGAEFMSPRSLNQPAEIVRSKIDCRHSSANSRQVVLDDKESIQYQTVQEQRFRLAKIIPSIAKEVEREKVGHQHNTKNSCLLQQKLLDELQEFLKEIYLPAMEMLDNIREQMYVGRRQSIIELDSLNRENAFLRDKVEEAYATSVETVKKIKSATNKEKIVHRKVPSIDKQVLQELEKELASVTAEVSSALKEAEDHAMEKEQMEDVLRSFYKKMKQLTWQRDHAKSQAKECNKALFQAKKELEERNDEVFTVKSDLLSLRRKSMRSLPIPKDLQADDVNEYPQIDEVSFIPGIDEVDISESMLEMYNEGDFVILDLNNELVGEEYENSDDVWLDEEVSSPSDITPCNSSSDLPGQTEEEEVKNSSQYQRDYRGFFDQTNEQMDDVSLTIVRNESINIFSSKEQFSASKGQRMVHLKNTKAPVIVKRKKRKVGSEYRQRVGAEPQRIRARGAKDFNEALALFKTLEKQNPKKIKSPEEQTTNRKDMISMLKPRSGKITSNPVKASKGKVVVRLRKKPKQHFMSPRRKGYLQIIPKTSQFSLKSKRRFERKYFVCLDALPSKTNTNHKEPSWVKDRTNDVLRPCIFWFLNEKKFNMLQKATSTMHVRSKEFQTKFAESALGIIVISPQSTVNTNEQRAITASESDILLQKSTFASEYGKSSSDFYMVVKSSNNESYESHKFRAKNEAERDKWIGYIRKFISKRRQHEKNISIASNTVKHFNESIISCGLMKSASSLSPPPQCTTESISSNLVVQLDSENNTKESSDSRQKLGVGELAMAFDKSASNTGKTEEPSIASGTSRHDKPSKSRRWFGGSKRRSRQTMKIKRSGMFSRKKGEML